MTTIPHPLIGLRAIRMWRNISLDVAASIVGVEPTSYARYETGARRCYFDRVCTLADALRCKVDDFRRDYTEDDLLHHFGLREQPAGEAPPVPPPPAPAPQADIVVSASDELVPEGWGEDV